MKTKIKVISLSAVVLVSTASASYFTYHFTKMSQMPDSTYEFEDVHVDEYLSKIEEINKNNINLIVYETKPCEYKAHYKEGEILPIEVTFSALYSYSLSIDLSKAITYSIGNQVYVSVNQSDVKIHKIEVSNINLVANNGPLSTLFKPNKIAKLDSVALQKSEDRISKLVNKNIQGNKDSIQSNLYNKLNALYKDFGNVHIIIKG